MNQVLLSQFNEKDKIDLSDLDGLASSKEETKIRSMQAFFASSFGTIVTKTTNAHEKAAASVAATANKNVSAVQSSTPKLTTDTADIHWPPAPAPQDEDEANSGYSANDIPTKAFDTIERLRDWMDYISKSPNLDDIQNFIEWISKVQEKVDADQFPDKYAEGKLKDELATLDVYSPSGGQLFKDQPASFSAVIAKIVEFLFVSYADKDPPPFGKDSTPDYNSALQNLKNLQTWLNGLGSSNPLITNLNSYIGQEINSFNTDISAGGWIYEGYMNTIGGVVHMNASYDMMYEYGEGYNLGFFLNSKGNDKSSSYLLYSQWAHNTVLDQIDISLAEVFGKKSKKHWPAQAIFLLLCILLSYVQRNQDDLAAHGGTSHILSKLTAKSSDLLTQFKNEDWSNTSATTVNDDAKALVQDMKFVSDMTNAFAESSLGSISTEITSGLKLLRDISGPTDSKDPDYQKCIDPNLPDDPNHPGQKISSTIGNILDQYVKDNNPEHLTYIANIMQYQYKTNPDTHQYPSGNQSGASGIQQVAEAVTNQSKLVQTEMSQVSQLINQVIGTFNSMLTELINQEKVKVQNEKQSS